MGRRVCKYIIVKYIGTYKTVTNEVVLIGMQVFKSFSSEILHPFYLWTESCARFDAKNKQTQVM